MATYATPDELAAFLDEPVDNPERMLQRASRRIRSALISAIYDPGASTVVQALKDAALEQCAYWADNGMDGSEPAGSAEPGAWSSVSAGSISLSRGTNQNGGSESAAARAAARFGLAEQAYLVLQDAGLLGHAPRNGAQGWC